MSRTASPSDFQVDVPGLGTFTFARRTQRDVYRIRGEYNKLTGGNYDDDGNFGDLPALAYVTVGTLVVEQPAGFDFARLDPLLDEACDEKVLKIFMALREKELSFRPGAGAGVQGAGAGDGEQLRAGVPAPLQPAAD